MENEIDIVFTWVDGNDPAHKKKIEPYLSKQAAISDDIAGPTRFRSVGEIFYSVSSILRYAPFVRKIFIITDEQNPNIDEFIRENFPDNKIPIEIVDHKVIFEGYEEYLPVFNSRAIETCTYRIPDLRENYVYFNDDCFLVRPIQPTDWFVDDKSVTYGKWSSIFYYQIISMLKPRKNGHKPVGFKDGMVTAARNYGYKKRYIHMEHVPHPLKKSVLAGYYAKHQDLFKANISYKVRDRKQINTQELYYLIMTDSNRLILKPSDNLLCMKPIKRGDGYLTKKHKTYENNPDIKFACIESLDMANESDQKRSLDWLQKVIGVKP